LISWTDSAADFDIPPSQVYGKAHLRMVIAKNNNVGVGSKKEVDLTDGDFLFVPQSTHPAVRLRCPLIAIKGHQRRNSAL
jgi:hypothetical protein